jgi:hypothetical protein
MCRHILLLHSVLLHTLRTVVYTQVSLFVISFLLHALRTAVYTQVSFCDLISASRSPYRSVYTGLSFCDLISASHSPYRRVYTGLSFLLQSHFCFTLSVPQCIHRFLFLVSACYLFQKLLYSCFLTVVKFLQ